MNTLLRPRPVAQRTWEPGRYIKGCQRSLHISRCEEVFRERLMRRVGWTLVAYVPVRRKHPAYRALPAGVEAEQHGPAGARHE
jgi:hypothetical protein